MTGGGRLAALRGHARSHKYRANFEECTILWERARPRTPAQPVPATASSFMRASPRNQNRLIG